MAHVLVVDDDDDIRDILFDFLMEEGYQVSLAQNGEQAIAILERERGLLVLLDLRLPGIDGEGVIRWIQDAQRTDHQVVVITAGRPVLLERRWLKEGTVRAVVHKPINIDQMLALLERLAPRKGQPS
ncbi:MAG TPA: response regulator [Ktedonobacterales bacterium]|nr:response regulator [Ktedonobacterales bacterium]